MPCNASIGGTTSGLRGWGFVMEGPLQPLTYNKSLTLIGSPSVNQSHSGRITGETYPVPVIIYIFVLLINKTSG